MMSSRSRTLFLDTEPTASFRSQGSYGGLRPPMNALRAAPREAWGWKTLGETPGFFLIKALSEILWNAATSLS